MNGALRRPLPPGGIDQAVHAGRRLRRRRAVGGGVTAACAAAVVVAGLLSVGPSSSLQRIEMITPGPVEAPDPRPVPLPAGGDLPAPTSPSPGPRASGPPTGTSLATASGTAVTATPGVPVRSPGAAPDPVPPSPAPTEADGGPVMTGPGKTDDTRSCQSPAAVPLNSYCTKLSGPATVRAGDSATFTYWVCRYGAPATVSYPTRQEAEFTVKNAPGTWTWRWSGGFAFPPRPHELTLDAGYCYTWSIEWVARDERGAPLRPGTYAMTANGTANEWADGGNVPSASTQEIRIVT